MDRLPLTVRQFKPDFYDTPSWSIRIERIVFRCAEPSLCRSRTPNNGSDSIQCVMIIIAVILLRSIHRQLPVLQAQIIHSNLRLQHRSLRMIRRYSASDYRPTINGCINASFDVAGSDRNRCQVPLVEQTDALFFLALRLRCLRRRFRYNRIL